MGLFSGIGKAIKGVVGAIAEPISSIAGVASDVLGIGAPFMEQRSSAEANRINIEEAKRQRDWQAEQNLAAMDFSAGQTAEQFERNKALQDRAFHFGRDTALTARRFEESMSNTAYQRAVKDLSAAGLNPMLAYTQGGASTPNAPLPSTPAASVGAGSGVSSAGASARVGSTFSAQSVASAVAARAQAAQVQNIRADTANKLLMAKNIEADTIKKGSESYERTTAGHVNQQTEEKLRKTTDAILDQIQADTEHSRQSAKQVESQNMAYKALLANPATAPIAPILQLLLQVLK